jgi:hypothetical protein
MTRTEPPQARPMARRLGLLAAAVLLATACAGAGIGLLLSPASPPPSLASASVGLTAVPRGMDYTDEQTVPFSVALGPSLALRSSRGGVATASACVPGASIVSGSSLFALDGVPVVQLATSTPLWRDIGIGDTGTDVTALQTELIRLGHSLEIDGRWGWLDISAFDAVLVAAGAPESDHGVVAMASVAWLPSSTVVASRCLVGVGMGVAPGQELVELPAQLAAAHAHLPSGIADGARVVVVGDQRYSIAEGGLITDPAALLAISDSAEFRERDPSSDPPTITLRVELEEPLRAQAIPPSAIYDLEHSVGCVQHGGSATKVRVIASQLGLALVVPSGELGPVLLAPDVRRGCR